MRKILAYVKTYNVKMWISLSLMGVELVVELIQPILMAIIIDQGIIKGDLATVTIWGSILLAISLLAFAAGVTNSFFAASVSQGVGHDLRRDLYRKVQEFASSHFKTFSTPSLITRMTNDVTQIQVFLFMSMRIALRAPLFIIGGMIMAFTVHVGLATILFVTVPVLLIFLLWILKKGVVLFQKVQDKLDSVNTVIRENLAGIRLIKVFHRGEYEENRFHNVNTSLKENNKKALWMMELGMPIIMFGMNLSLIAIIWYGALELNIGNAQAGEIVAVLNYGTRMMFTFSVFTFLLMNFSRGKASANRIHNVLKEETTPFNDTKTISHPINGDVRFECVSFTYPSMTQPALHNVSLSVKSGEIVGILGETGSGKSSLIHLIPRLGQATAGEIYIDSVEINSFNIKSLRERVSLVPQEVHLFSGSIKENIGWGNDQATLEDIVQAAKDAEIHDFIMTLPDGYETKLGQKGVNFSGGQKQRISIARALVRKPSILILDDSTSALDAHTESKLLKSLKEQGCTTFIVAQKISSIKEADQILLLHQGQIIAHGKHETLLKENGDYQKIYNSQRQEEVV